MSASIIIPTRLTDAMLVSSTLAEDDYAEWVYASYVVGEYRIITSGLHRVYICLVDHTSTDNSGAPNLNLSGATPKWLEVGPTNRWAMFDEKIGTISSTTSSPLTVVFNPGPIGGLALLELAGRKATVSFKDVTGGQVVYETVIDLDGTVVDSFFDWFFAEFEQQTDLTLTNLPSQYYNGEVTVSIESTQGAVACGVCHVGRVAGLGQTQLGATIGIVSYSVKETDDFGRLTIIKRQNSKRASIKTLIPKSAFNRIYRTLAGVDSVLCIYVATEEAGYTPLILYGIWRDFVIDVTYPTNFLTSLEIEGLAQ
jgi:hypothetical protein